MARVLRMAAGEEGRDCTFKPVEPESRTVLDLV